MYSPARSSIAPGGSHSLYLLEPELPLLLEEPPEALLLAGVLLTEAEESCVDEAGLLSPESDFLSAAAADISDLLSDLLAESEEDAALLPDFA